MLIAAMPKQLLVPDIVSPERQISSNTARITRACSQMKRLIPGAISSSPYRSFGPRMPKSSRKTRTCSGICIFDIILYRCSRSRRARVVQLVCWPPCQKSSNCSAECHTLSIPERSNPLGLSGVIGSIGHDSLDGQLASPPPAEIACVKLSDFCHWSEFNLVLRIAEARKRNVIRPVIRRKAKAQSGTS